MSTHADVHLLKTPEAEAREKDWDEERLREWEHDANGGEPWPGRPPPLAESTSGNGVNLEDEETLFAELADDRLPPGTGEDDEEELQYTQTDDDSWIK